MFYLEKFFFWLSLIIRSFIHSFFFFQIHNNNKNIANRLINQSINDWWQKKNRQKNILINKLNNHSKQNNQTFNFIFGIFDSNVQRSKYEKQSIVHRRLFLLFINIDPSNSNVKKNYYYHYHDDRYITMMMMIIVFFVNWNSFFILIIVIIVFIIDFFFCFCCDCCYSSAVVLAISYRFFFFIYIYLFMLSLSDLVAKKMWLDRGQ